MERKKVPLLDLSSTSCHKKKLVGMRLILAPVVVLLVLLLSNHICALPLDDIMNQPEPNFKWEVIANQTTATRASIVLNMTSVQYLTTEYVDRVVWSHHVYIYAGIPNTASHVLHHNHFFSFVTTYNDCIGIVIY